MNRLANFLLFAILSVLMCNVFLTYKLIEKNSELSSDYFAKNSRNKNYYKKDQVENQPVISSDSLKINLDEKSKTKSDSPLDNSSAVNKERQNLIDSLRNSNNKLLSSMTSKEVAIVKILIKKVKSFGDGKMHKIKDLNKDELVVVKKIKSSRKSFIYNYFKVENHLPSEKKKETSENNSQREYLSKENKKLLSESLLSLSFDDRVEILMGVS